MALESSTDTLDVYVWEGTSGMAARVSQFLADLDVNVILADKLASPIVRTNEQLPAVAIVSVTVVSGRGARPTAYDGLIGQGWPVIWVAADERGVTPGFYPPSYTSILPPGFTGTELRTLLFQMVADMRASRAAATPSTTEPLIAVSETMQHLLAEATAVADCSANVLVYGETGTGKERIARLLHERNREYGSGPFVAVNCGAIPEGMFESLFFGHVKGAFTGAVASHRGYFEQAHGGTLFLDEIGDLPLFQQVKLLRVLEQNVITKLGSAAEIRVNFRLVAATHRDLQALIQNDQFRADLYYRLAVAELYVPSLEERGAADKIAIFEGLLERMLPSGVRAPDAILRRIGSARFDGNVRQLRNVAERVALVHRQFGGWDEFRLGRVLETLRLADGASEQPPEWDERDQAERQRVLAALNANGWHRQHSAAALGVSRKVLWEKMRKFRLQGREAEEEAPPETDDAY